MKAYQQAAAQIPGELGRTLRCIPDSLAQQVLEIRLRAGLAPVLTLRERPYILQAEAPTVLQMQQLLEALCSYSIYSWQESIRQGYITLQGGHRVGIGGKIVQDTGKSIGVCPVLSLNIRIARDSSFFLSNELKLRLQEQGGLVVAGPPASGKTTFLKQAIRYLSDMGQRVCVVDERCELSGTRLPQHCDLLQNCGKAEGLLWAVRGLSPQVLICDEIGAEEDADAVCVAANAGVRLIVSMHGCTKQQLLRRPPCKKVLETGAFSSLIFLGGGNALGSVQEVEWL